MDTKRVNILTVNAGSSSLKLVLFSVNPATPSFERVFEISIVDIGQPLARLNFVEDDERRVEQCVVADHAAAIELIIQKVADRISIDSIAAVGHRIVYGGKDYSQPTRITDDVEERLRSFASFDPEHVPAALQFIDTLRQRFAHITQVACFDTAFFHDLPRVAQIVPIPHKYDSQGVRRYGFHGLSYSYLLSAFQAMAGETAAHGRVIFAHLGSGASLAATRDGKPVDTTMGFTPASGVVMSTRSGDIDPGLAWFLNQQTGMSLEEYNHMVNFESGLLGVSELSGDMYTLLQNEATNEQAAEAVNLFCYQVRKSIGALAATIGGLDSLVFSGGIGEQAIGLRARICNELGFLGIDLDDASNAQHASLISVQGSRVGVHVIPTDEALVIAKQVVATLDVYQEKVGDSRWN